MNKDLDERLVPNGLYRDALNINVSVSEGSDSGAVENIKGNLELKNKALNASTNVYTEWSSDYINNALTNPVCIGSIADSVNEKIYWFIASEASANLPYGVSAIASYDKSTDIVTPILVDGQNILKFSKDYLITGINIIEDLLFWTDNKEEPKKINLKEWQGSTTDFATHSQIYGRDFIERDIVVIKPAPLKQPLLTLSKNLGVGNTSTTAAHDFTTSGTVGTIAPGPEVGDVVSINLGSAISANAGDTLNFTCNSPSSEGDEPVDVDGNPDIYIFSISINSLTEGGTILNVLFKTEQLN